MSIFRAALCTLACALTSAGVWAQDITTSTTHKGPSMYETTVKSGTVIYVSGNDLLVKLSGGEVEHFVVPDSATFTVDGKQMTLRELKPGTHLSQAITTKTTPSMITTVRTIDGKVWHVNPPTYVILTLPDGTNKEYRVPKDQIFMVNGQKDTVFQLKKGMMVSATVVKEEPVTEVSQHKAVTGVLPKPQVPDTVDTLLVETSQQPAQPTQPTQTAAAEPAPQALPKTGSEWPLVGLVGLATLGVGMLTRRIRMAWK
jgi:LPXTG-motif cell wall-anchored protein